MADAREEQVTAQVSENPNDFKTFQSDLIKKITESYEALNETDVIKMWFGSDVDLYVTTGNSDGVVNFFNIITKQNINGITVLKDSLKNAIHGLNVAGTYLKKNAGKDKYTDINKLFEKKGVVDENDPQKRIKEINAAISTPEINATTIINLIANAVLVRRLAFLYAYATVTEKIFGLLSSGSSSSAVIPVKPGGVPNPFGTAVTTNDINHTDCIALLNKAGIEIQNLRDIIRNLLLFHNEDVNLGMHSGLIKDAQSQQVRGTDG